jgi:hypothetical protein
VALPDHVDKQTGAVYFDEDCSIPMRHLGYECLNHEYKCNGSESTCGNYRACQRYRFIPLDSGYFQRIPFGANGIAQAHAIRKNCERPFNLLKHQVGLETLRVRSQHAAVVRATISSIAVLLIAMAGKRKKKKPIKFNPQLSLLPKAA